MTPIESAVRAVCCAVMGVEDLAPEDNLVDRGADSLLASEIVDRLELQFGVDVVEEFFAQPTIASLAEAIRTRAPEPTAGVVPAADAAPAER